MATAWPFRDGKLYYLFRTTRSSDNNNNNNMLRIWWLLVVLVNGTFFGTWNYWLYRVCLMCKIIHKKTPIHLLHREIARALASSHHKSNNDFFFLSERARIHAANGINSIGRCVCVRARVWTWTCSIARRYINYNKCVCIKIKAVT